MRTTSWLVFIYSILILIGGIVGYFKGGSPASLLAGTLFGLLLLLSFAMIFRGKNRGVYLALILCLILDVFFTYRFMDKMKVFPSGVMSILSLAMVVILALRLRNPR
jgi:uncharacterized membrane protein (UPF0136 family)